jgi:hypothetical protein
MLRTKSRRADFVKVGDKTMKTSFVYSQEKTVSPANSNLDANSVPDKESPEQKRRNGTKHSRFWDGILNNGNSHERKRHFRPAFSRIRESPLAL